MAETTRARAVFLDRDGTITKDTVFSADPAKLAALPGAVEGLRRLQDAGYEFLYPELEQALQHVLGREGR